jgi:hypothetical protein
VYTRTHTPRFSGHPSSAGDFVLTRIFSRPFRTSCENVGTPSPLPLKTLHHQFVYAWRFDPRSTLRVHEQKGRQTLRNYKVLRADASPRGVNCICSNTEEAFTALRGWRPISAALSDPVPFHVVPGSKDFPSPHQAQRPLDNRASIGKTTTHVNSIPLWKSRNRFCAGRRAR